MAAQTPSGSGRRVPTRAARTLAFFPQLVSQRFHSLIFSWLCKRTTRILKISGGLSASQMRGVWGDHDRAGIPPGTWL